MSVVILNNLDCQVVTVGNMKFPFEQQEQNGKLIRTFLPTVDTEELKWHQDLKDRRVKILKSGGWLFQMEDSLPSKLLDGDVLEIPKLAWHRVIKGNEQLVVEIQEF